MPDSEISGLQSVSDSPELFAAVHVLHRLSMPRHPPRALSSLAISLRHASLSIPGLDTQALTRALLLVLYDLNHTSSIQFSKTTIRDCHGADRDRTGDFRLAKPALSQLSYNPKVHKVGLARLELATSPLSGVRSNQLSYSPGGACTTRESVRLRFREQVGLPLKTESESVVSRALTE